MVSSLAGDEKHVLVKGSMFEKQDAQAVVTVSYLLYKHFAAK